MLPLVAAAMGVGTPAAEAQESRAEAIAQEQARKSEALDVEGPGTAERVVIRVLRSPLLAGTGGVYPWFGSVHEGTGTAVGGGYLRRLPRSSRIHVLGGVSVRGLTLIEARARLPEIRRGLGFVDLGARRTEARGLTFFGIGPDTDAAAPVFYDSLTTELRAAATLAPRRHLHVVGGYRYVDLGTTPGDRRAPGPVVPGLGETLAYHVLDAGAAVDTRDAPGYSTRGGLYRAAWSRHAESSGRPFSFDSLEYEVVQLVPLVREQFVLAFRGLATTTLTGEADEIPFVMAPFLGSGDTLRGFRPWRFTDRSRILLSGEYRWRPSRFLDLAVFADAGQVGPRLDAVSLSTLETSWGVGGRFHGPSFTALRAEIARSREGVRFILAGSRAF